MLFEIIDDHSLCASRCRSWAVEERLETLVRVDLNGFIVVAVEVPPWILALEGIISRRCEACAFEDRTDGQLVLIRGLSFAVDVVSNGVMLGVGRHACTSGLLRFCALLARLALHMRPAIANSQLARSAS